MRLLRYSAVVVLLLGPATRTGAQTDFQWRNPMTPGQTLEIKNVNGDIRAVASDSGSAEVTATKTARRSNPDEVRIEVVPHAGGVTICAVYPGLSGDDPNRCEPGSETHSRTHNNDTTVRFDVRVPAGVHFVARTVNGGVEADSLSGDAEGYTVNGSVRVSTTGVALATTVNGSLNVTMGRADWPGGGNFSSVNGGITLHLPPVLNANLRASVLNGTIASDFPITVTGEVSRRRVAGVIGNGGQDLNISTVNGSITLLKAP